MTDTNEQQLIDELSMEAFKLTVVFDVRAFEIAGEVRRRSLAIGYKKGYSDSLIRLAVAHYNVAEYHLALELLEEAIHLHRESGNSLGESVALFEKARSLGKLGQLAEALENHFKALAINESMGELQSTASSLNSIGVIYKTMGELPDALRYYLRACAVYESLGKTTQAAGVLNNIGSIYMGLGENKTALEYSMKSLSLQNTDIDRALYSYTLNSIGVAYQRLGEYDRSLQYLMQSLEIKQALGASDSVGNSIMNIGVVYQDSGDYTTANDFFQKALAIFEPTGNINLKCLVLLNLGVNHIHCKEYEKAREILLESLDLASHLGNTSLIAEISLPLGNLMRLAGDFENAIEYYEQALLVARDTKNKELTRKINKMLVECWKESGNPQRALECFRVFTQLDNEVNHHQSRITINTMLVGFETAAERQQQELIKLRTENLIKDLENKNRNLEAIAKEMLKKQQMLRTLKEEIESCKKTESPSTQKKLVHLQDHIISHDAGISGWQALEQRFKHQFPEFSASLTSRYPHLSNVEVKVCCLLKIGLITKEIADLLFVSERTIDFHRTSIRKKIGLDSKENLTRFFNVG